MRYEGEGVQNKITHREILFTFLYFCGWSYACKKKNISSFRFRGAVDRKISVNIIIIFYIAPLLLSTFQISRQQEVEVETKLSKKADLFSPLRILCQIIWRIFHFFFRNPWIFRRGKTRFYFFVSGKLCKSQREAWPTKIT